MTNKSDRAAQRVPQPISDRFIPSATAHKSVEFETKINQSVDRIENPSKNSKTAGQDFKLVAMTDVSETSEKDLRKASHSNSTRELIQAPPRESAPIMQMTSRGYDVLIYIQ